MSDLPMSWVQVPLSELVDFSGGGTPSKADPSLWSDGTIPWVSPKDMKTFRIFDSEDHVSNRALERLSLLPAGTVLVVVRSGILSRTLPVAVTSLPVTVNQDLRALIPNNGVVPDFLAYQLISAEQQILESCSKNGTTVASIEGPAFARFAVNLPPFEEQKRILAKLEELLSDLDAGVAELKAAQAKLVQYRQSLLKAAVDGSLTAEWRKTHKPKESGAELLERILAERRRRWEEKQLAKFKEQGKAPPKGWENFYPHPVKPDTSNLPDLPEGWVWASVDQLASVGTGVTPLRSNPSFYESGTIPWITSGALNEELVAGASEFVTQKALESCRLELYPSGTLLIAMYGEGKTRGKCSELCVPATINQAIAALVLDGIAASIKAYVKIFLLKSYDDMRKQASGGVQPNLNLQIIRSIAIPLPSLEEQGALDQSISDCLNSVQEHQVTLEASLSRASAQRKNILKAAFSGQLVPQDPTDESASVLLERIRAERAAGGSKAGVKRGRMKRGCT